MKLKEILTHSEKRKAVAQIRNAVPCASNYHDCMFEMPQSEWDAYRIFEDDTSGTFAGISPDGNFKVYSSSKASADMHFIVSQLIELNNGILPKYYRGNIETSVAILQNQKLLENFTNLQPIANFSISMDEVNAQLKNREPLLGDTVFFKARNTSEHLKLVEECFQQYNAESGSNYTCKIPDSDGIYGLYIMTAQTGELIGGFSIELPSDRYTWGNRAFVTKKQRGTLVARALWHEFLQISVENKKPPAFQYARSNNAAKKFYLKMQCQLLGTTFYAKFF